MPTSFLPLDWFSWVIIAEWFELCVSGVGSPHLTRFEPHSLLPKVLDCFFHSVMSLPSLVVGVGGFGETYRTHLHIDSLLREPLSYRSRYIRKWRMGWALLVVCRDSWRRYPLSTSISLVALNLFKLW